MERGRFRRAAPRMERGCFGAPWQQSNDARLLLVIYFLFFVDDCSVG